MFSSILFFVFSAVLIGAALGVILARNPVHCALLLVLCFFNSAVIWLMLDAEFLGIVLVLVYVGAVMVLFLFVVMMLDIDFGKLRQGFANYLGIGGFIALILLMELIFVAISITQNGAVKASKGVAHDATQSNIAQIGDQLFTTYAYLFESAGFVLLVAMIGAIVLTLRHRTYVKRQDIYKQVTRRRKDAVAIVKVKTGEGIEE
jgi:NADH-quinone oxidoreductase subunit J